MGDARVTHGFFGVILILLNPCFPGAHGTAGQGQVGMPAHNCPNPSPPGLSHILGGGGRGRGGSV